VPAAMSCCKCLRSRLRRLRSVFGFTSVSARRAGPNVRVRIVQVGSVAANRQRPVGGRKCPESWRQCFLNSSFIVHSCLLAASIRTPTSRFCAILWPEREKSGALWPESSNAPCVALLCLRRAPPPGVDAWMSTYPMLW
jgi:hypothetical protein